jgi:ketosteroid isomerase-like protein
MASVRDEVANLAGRYCAAVLSGSPDDFSACWAEDAEWIVPGGYTHSGRERIVHVFTRARVPFRLCVQELLSGVVEPVGEGSGAARAVWQIRELQWRTDGSQTFLIGTYTDDCVRGDDGVWRFARREFDEVLRDTF